MDASPVVLVVDDEHLMRMTLRHKLTREGYRVDLAGSAREATDRLLRFHYDLVLTDLRLNDACGVEVLQTAHRVDPHLPVLVLTGSDDDPAAVDAASGQIRYPREALERVWFANGGTAYVLLPGD